MKNEIIALIPMIRRFAYSLTGNHHDADDLLQNTIERILTKGVPEDVELTKWMFRVCRNLWIDEYRSRQVRQAATQSPELHEQAVQGEQEQTQKLRVREVNQAMSVLPTDQRSILSLVAIQGMSYKEVSETLSIPIGTVMSRLARARSSLSQCLPFQGVES
ncbi:RNA polymerase sigma factor [Thalassotalea castellviae]|uniref:RNA polymerase sigma factor n=1 Tax=Thalassotalea castellviae TaxID=3075612 RepID=A0ABU3A612_9GAMM|nr:RNA polymerase sigma factor [Thalassotalea sp. W431]MDT0604982.1 RNA polymerase sigma factor [Thalassotalea sp. W431]